MRPPICAALLLAGLATPFVLAHAQTPDSQHTTLGGYGEVQYTNHSGAGTPGQANLKRFVLYLGHQFSERITLRSELEVEDAKIEGGDAGGEVSLEQAYLEYRLGDAFALSAGLMLAPVGIVNEFHEPPTFNGVARPDFHHDVLPTTWREIGVGAGGRIGSLGGVSWRVLVLNGITASGFSGAEGIRGGRQEGRNASFANPSLTGRLEYGRPGLKVGASFWVGGSANQDSLLGTGGFDAPVSVLAADARYDVGAFQFRGEVARVAIADADRINAAFGGDVGSRIEGGYLEGGADLFVWLAPASRQRLVVFVRHERYDTHAAVPMGTPRNAAYARRVTTVGLTYKPLWNVVVKGDYQLLRNRAHVGAGEIMSFGIGYQF